MMKRVLGANKKENEELPMSNVQKRSTGDGGTKKHFAKLISSISLPWRHMIVLILIWLCSIQYFERIYVENTIKKCDWTKWEQWDKKAEPYRVAIYGDPQIMDGHSYPGRPRIVNALTMKVLDSYHKKNWRYIQNVLDPKANIFLGDLFDGGRYWENDTWMKEYHRFNSIFEKKEHRVNIMSLPGNHDIGFGDTVIESSYNRFTTYFGETSSRYELGNHTFYLIDTIALSDTKLPHLSEKVAEYLDNVDENQSKTNPRIMLTHVPLYRNPSVQTCGPHRESKKEFPIMYGDQYQTVIDPGLSEKVLTSVKPDLIFSGDDHDYCEVQHTYTVNDEDHVADEITTKSCAMNMGISRPGVQLLSLYNPGNSLSNKKTYETTICYLPDPFTPILAYVGLGVFSFIYLSVVLLLPKFYNKRVLKNVRSSFQKITQEKATIAIKDEANKDLLPRFESSGRYKGKSFLRKTFEFVDSIMDEFNVEMGENNTLLSLIASVFIMFICVFYMFFCYYNI